MSKAAKKYGEDAIKVPVSSLAGFAKDGHLTKQGGSIKSWKRRYFVVKDAKIYYYKTPKDQTLTGRIDLEPSSFVKEDNTGGKSKKPFQFSVKTQKRHFLMYADTAEDMNAWISAIQREIDSLGKTGSTGIPKAQESLPEPRKSSGGKPPVTTPVDVDMSPRARLNHAKGAVDFLKEEDSKVLEFWQIWSESIPVKEDLSPGMSIEFQVAASADMQKLTWRTAGPQNVFIQKMVDFFWNVGAPESEIDRLNDVGALINPVKIGSWIDMSAKGGMDGGWFFPVDIPLKLAVEAADGGPIIKKFSEWAEEHGVTSIFAVGRDMGAAPPRQTEMRFTLPGGDFAEQLRIAVSAFSSFGVPAIPDEAMKILQENPPSQRMTMSVITSAEGFVRLGLLVPSPKTQTVIALCNFAGSKHEEIAAFEGSLGSQGPAFVEYQYLMKTFGYGVYKEGFDVVFHYHIGEEVLD